MWELTPLSSLEITPHENKDDIKEYFSVKLYTHLRRRLNQNHFKPCFPFTYAHVHLSKYLLLNNKMHSDPPLGNVLLPYSRNFSQRNKRPPEPNEH